MILYFADRNLNILGMASTHLPKGIVIEEDLKTEDIETGVSIFECDVTFDRSTREKVEEWAEVGNYIFRSSDNENELFSIIDAEIDTKNQKVYIYAEDDGLDLLNEVVGSYEADQYYPISHYINKYASGSGWEIGINEVEGLTRKLSFDGEETTSARLLKIAEAFNDCELSYSFDIDGLTVSKKYINIYEERGKTTGIQLRLNKEIDKIVTTKTLSNLATALQCTGGTPDNADTPITLKGYVYDDGDFYVDGSVLKSRKALAKWSRFLWKGDESQQAGGHIVKQYSDDSLSQEVLCVNAIAELKRICDMEVNYDVDITNFPENVNIGDRVNIIDDDGALYLSSRILILETSCANNTRKAVLGEHIIRKSGISSKVEKLAAEFAKSTVSVQRAREIAVAANEAATTAKEQAEAAESKVDEAKAKADEAKAAADVAKEAADNAKATAQEAKNAVTTVEESVASITDTVNNAQAAANNAHQAAETAAQKAEEAKQSAEAAAENAATAKAEAESAKNSVAIAIERANSAEAKANEAKASAASAIEEAKAAKEDAKKAEAEIDELDKSLTTISQTMKADYSRKTDLTEAAATLQSQITQNAAGIKSNAFKYVEIDETTNNAASKVEAAQKAAAAAQEYADQASLEAQNTAQEAAEALAAAQSAQNEADTARRAADDARAVADKAEADLEAAKTDLATVKSRADATEEEIAAAQEAVDIATAAAEEALIVADQAAAIAESAQDIANSAVDEATKAQANADAAAQMASLAQQAANEANGNAAAVKQLADSAALIAAEAQTTANAAKATADQAQATADEAATTAAKADLDAQEAKAVALKADADLAQAQENLANVLAKVDATQEEVEAAQSAVAVAQENASRAETEAETAQANANAAKADAEEAQEAADIAKAAANEAQQAAKEAQAEADLAQGIVNALERRTTAAESNIEQTAENITLSAKENKVITDALAERISSAEAALKVLSDSISMLVKNGDKESLMVQDEESATWAFSTESIDKAISDTADNLGTLEEALGSTKETVDALKSTLDGLQDRVKITTYENEPCIILYDETEFQKIITNTRVLHIRTTASGNEIISEEDFETLRKKRVKVEEAQVGQWVWKQRTNGNLCLVWESEVEQ